MNYIFKNFRLGTLLAGAFLLMFGCNQSNKKTEAAVVKDSVLGAVTTAPAAARLTDPQIASIAVTANQIDIDYANIALKKSGNSEVKKFATTMAKDHQAVIDQAVALANKLGVTPADNPTTQSLLTGAASMKSAFDTKTGAAFDKAYVDNEVEYHKAAISLVEGRLVPESTNPELKALLQSALPLFNDHLKHAQMVQNALNK